MDSPFLINYLLINVKEFLFYKCFPYLCTVIMNELKNKKMSKSNNSRGFIYVMSTPSEEGLVYINVSEEEPNKEVEEAVAKGLISDKFEVILTIGVDNPFKVFNIVETIIDKYRMVEGRNFFKVDFLPFFELVTNVSDLINENYDKSSTEGRYGVRGSSLESRPELKEKRFKTVEELTSMGIEDIDIYDHRTCRGVTK